MNIIDLMISDNIEPDLDPSDVNRIAIEVVRGYEIDKESREPWDIITERALQIARQTFERKSAPNDWESNIKLPIIPTAIMSYAARAYPEVIKNNAVVHAAIVGADNDGSKEQRAKRISDHMSWQLLVQDKAWEPSFDKLLHVYAFLGTAFKKVYYDPITKMNKSELCLPDRIYVNNGVDSLESARRITQKIYLYENDIYERIKLGLFSDYLDELPGNGGDPDDEGVSGSDDPDQFHCFLEQHCYLDLDDDGYKEPYIVTIHQRLNKIFRIKACFDERLMDIDAETGEVKKIPRKQYFVDFHLEPAPDGSFYSLGYGHLLYPLNDAANSLLNQTIDAGTKANRQTLLLGRGFRGNPGDITLAPGRAIKMDISGDDLQKNVLPLPVKDPSPVLMQLLEFIYDKADKLASVSDIMQGQQAAQNVSPTTVLTLLEQGLKPYSAQQKRLYRSLTKEFTILYSLNAQYLDKDQYYNIEGVSQQIGKDDYQDHSIQVSPVSDPSLSSDSQRMMQSQALFQIMPQLAQPLTAGQQAVMQTFLDSLKIPMSLAQKIMQPPPPPGPSPDMVKAQADAQKAQDALKTNEVDRQIKIVTAQKELSESQTQHMKELATIKLLDAQAINYLAQAHAQQTSVDLKTYIDELNSLIEVPVQPTVSKTDTAASAPTPAPQPVAQQPKGPAPAPQSGPPPEPPSPPTDMTGVPNG